MSGFWKIASGHGITGKTDYKNAAKAVNMMDVAGARLELSINDARCCASACGKLADKMEKSDYADDSGGMSAIDEHWEVKLLVDVLNWHYERYSLYDWVLLLSRLVKNTDISKPMFYYDKKQNEQDIDVPSQAMCELLRRVLRDDELYLFPLPMVAVSMILLWLPDEGTRDRFLELPEVRAIKLCSKDLMRCRVRMNTITHKSTEHRADQPDTATQNKRKRATTCRGTCVGSSKRKRRFLQCHERLTP